jgi:hypothetical protein
VKTTIHQEQQRQTLLKYGNFKYVPVQICLKPVVDHWTSLYTAEDPGYDLVTNTISKHPQLLEPTEDVSVFHGHEDFMEALFAPVFPRHGWIQSYQAVTPPFTNVPYVVATEKYSELFNEQEAQFDLLNTQMGRKKVDHRLMYFYKAVFKKFYNLDLAVEEPIIASCLNKENGLMRYFKLTGNTNFIDIVNTAPLPDMDARKLQGLLDSHFDPHEWEQVIPMENFLFRGVTLITLVDVTLEESATRLQLHLLEKDAGLQGDWFTSVQQEFRNLFKLPDLRVGVATLQRDGQLNRTSPRPLWNSLFGRELTENPDGTERQTIYQDLIAHPRTIILEDIRDESQYSDDPIVRKMVDDGFRNLLLAPLIDEGKVAGILELINSSPGAINGLSLFKINRLKPIFASALKRHSEEFESRVKAVMLENFTAIHPSIEWKFRNAAIQILEKRDPGLIEESLKFYNLIPFYGSLDIRDSSRKRNQAVLKDLEANLKDVRDLLVKGHTILGLSVLDEHVYHIEKKLDAIQSSGSSSEEQSLANFIREKINPVVKHLKERYHVMEDLAEAYLEKVCADSGIFTDHRRAYENALALVNSCIVNQLEDEEASLEQQFPCYFDTYKTDGVEYNIYIGQDISPDAHFDSLHLESLRLQQLKWTCKIVRSIAALQPEIEALLSQGGAGQHGNSGSTPPTLQIAPLILVYSEPITLKFRMDEKHLDVDGSYNVRYEIVKKRIDKATIQGTGERLTQPGHIAIVYSHASEVEVYERHLEYLAARKEIESGWEHFDLEPMPGTGGMKALRAKVI